MENHKWSLCSHFHYFPLLFHQNVMFLFVVLCFHNVKPFEWSYNRNMLNKNICLCLKIVKLTARRYDKAVKSKDKIAVWRASCSLFSPYLNTETEKHPVCHSIIYTPLNCINKRSKLQLPCWGVWRLCEQCIKSDTWWRLQIHVNVN